MSNMQSRSTRRTGLNKSAAASAMGIGMAVLLILIMTVFGGCRNVTPEPTVPETTEPSVEILDTDAKTLEQLQELMKREEDLQITLNVDLNVDSAITVVGNKSVTGSGKLVAELSGRAAYAIFDVQPGATLQMEGLSLDGNATADGIVVREGGKADIRNVSVAWPYQYGVAAYDDVLLENVTVDNSPTAAVLASSGTVTVSGGSYTNSHSLAMYVEKEGTLNLEDEPVITGSGKHGITNRGLLNVYSGSITDCAQYSIVNYGMLTLDYEGQAEDGRIELGSNGKGAIYNYAGGTVDAKDLHVHSNKGSGISNNGKMTLVDSVISGSGTNGIYNTSVFTGSGLTIEKSGNCGVYNLNPGNLELSNSLVQDSTKRGVHNKGGVIGLESVSISTCGTHGLANTVDDYQNPGEIVANNINITGANTSVYNEAAGVKTTVTNSTLSRSVRTNVVVSYGTMVLDNTEILGTVDKGTYCLQIAKGAECTVSGNSVITGAAARGVTNHGVLVFTGGEIYGNRSTASGGGIYTDGILYLIGGNIHDNVANGAGGGVSVGYSSSDPALVGKLYMYGCSIYNNIASTNGGGVYVSKGTSYNGGDTVYCEATIIGGSIRNNTAKLGTAVMFSANSTFGGDVVIGSESDVRLNSGVVLTVSEFKHHNKENPVRFSAAGAAGTVVMEAESEAAASAVFDAIVSTTSTIGFEQTGKQIVLNAGEYVTTDGPDMTGAEVIEVSDFEALKAAVEGTKTGEKRLVKVMNDIAMEGTVSVPAGATVTVTDNGTAVVLIRSVASGNLFDIPADAIFALQGSEAGTLVLDGNKASVAADSALLNVAGEVHLTKVTLRDNKAASGLGGLITANSGILNVTDSVLTGGDAKNGGAIFINGAQVTVKNTEVSDCTATASGGAIRYQGGILVVEGGSFIGNSGSAGGAIAADNGVILTMSGTVLKNNIARGSHGGAVYLTNSSKLEGSVLTFEGNHTEGDGSYYGGALGLNSASVAELDSCVFDGNYCDHAGNNNGGAIYAGKNTKVTISGTSEFRNNYVATNGGAIYGNNSATVKVTGKATFENNRAASGGMAYVIGYTLDIQGADIIENSATGSGGALYVKPDSNNATTLTVADSTFRNNVSGGYGGVINVAGAGSAVSFTDCAFEGNSAKAANNANTLMVSGNSALTVKNVTVTPANTAVGDVRVNANGVLNIAGKCDLGMVMYAANTARMHVTEALEEGTQIRLLPAAYTEGDAVITAKNAELLAKAADHIAVVAPEGEEWKVSEEGKLVNDTKQALIGTTGYATLAEALEQVQAGQTITLTANVSGDVTIPAGVVLDGNGKTLSGSVTVEDTAVLKNLAVHGNVTLEGNSDLTTVTATGTVYVEAGKAVTVGRGFGAAQISLAEGATIELASALGANVSVVVQSAVQTVDTVILTGDAELIQSEYQKFSIALPDGTLQLGESGKIEKIPFKATVVGGDSYDTLEAAMEAAESGATIQINNDYTVTAEITVSKQLTITTVTDTGCTISRGSSNTAAVFNIVAGGDLTLSNITVDGGNIVSSKALVENAGIFTLDANSSLIQGNNSAQAGGLDNLEGGVATINGLAANNTGKNGGAIRNYNGATLYVNAGAMIRDNRATGNGGGIHQSGTMTLGAATLQNNSAAGYSGALHFGSTGSETVNGTVFIGNSAEGVDQGGGVSYVSGGRTVVLTNVTVQGTANTRAADRGGAFLIGSKASLTLSGTANSISGVTADKGVVYNNGGTFVMDGGSISNNNSTVDGGALFNAANNSSMYVKNTAFTGNYSVKNGAAVSHYKGTTVTLENCTVTGNTADGNGGGIWVHTNCALIIKGGTYQNNSSKDSADIRLNKDTASLDLTDSTVENTVIGTVSGVAGSTITNPNGVEFTDTRK